MYKNRIEKIKKQFAQKGIEAALVTKDENKFYLSGFRSSNFYIVLTQEKDYLLTDFRYIEAAEQNSGTFEIVQLKGQPDSIFSFLKENLTGKTIGIEEGCTTYTFYKALCDHIDPSKLVSQVYTVENARRIKDETECGHIRSAALIAEKGLAHILPLIKPGVSEMEIALELEFFVRRNGAEKLSFESIIASGENSSKPHGSPGLRKFRSGDMITMDFGCMVSGYCSDMTRTVAVGSVSPQQREVYDTVKKAQQEALISVRAGITGKEIDKAARDIITEEGYGEYFGHGTGHGVGLEIHEAPSLNDKSTDILEENMLVTIEPGIYLPGQFGVRIEDLAIVKNDGIINLCQSSKELIIL